MKKFYVLQIDKFKTVDVVGISKHNTRDLRDSKNKHSKCSAQEIKYLTKSALTETKTS